MTLAVTLDEDQKFIAEQQAADITVDGPLNIVSSNTFVFFAAFDGTRNGANPADDGSGNSQTTVVRQLYLQTLPNGVPVGNTGGIYREGARLRN